MNLSPSAELQAGLDQVRAPFRHPVYGGPLRVLVGYLVLVEIVLQVVFGHIDIPFVDVGWIEIGRKADSIPRGVILGGMVIGSLYALVAMGLILVYRANRVINFAQVSLGAVPATLALLLVARQGVPYLIAVPVAIVGAAVLGAGVEVTIVRRFVDAPRLILTVATIGIGLLLAALEFFTKLWVTGSVIDILTLEFNTPFDGIEHRIGVATLSGNHFAAIVVVAVLVTAVASLLRFTDIGIAIRASAQNRDRAALLGIPVRRVSTIVWAIAAVLSAIGVFLRAPIVGIQFGGTISLFVLLFGLTAAVIARMDSLPTALFAGMFIGIVDRIAIFSSNRASIAIAVMVPVVLIALLLQRKQMSRAFAMESSSWTLAREYRAVPAELRDLPEVRWGRVGVFALCGLVAVLFPYLIGNVESGLATRMVVFAMIGLSLVILTGWAGQISLGQFGLAGIGAAVGGGLAANHNVDFFVVMLIAGLSGGVAAVLIGLPALRIQGLFLAVTTLAFGLAVEAYGLHKEFFGWVLPKPGRFVEPPALWGKFDLGSSQDVSVFGLYHFRLGNEQKLYYVGLVLLIVLALGARSLRSLRTGRVLIGTRDNSRLVQAFGINPSSARLAAFAISGFVAGLGGMLLAFQQASVDQATFGANESIKALVMVVIGGIGSLPGAILGVVFVLGVPLLPGLRSIDQIDTLVSGFGVLVVLLVFPGGLSQLVYGQRDTFLRWVAGRRGIHVPSLVADSLVSVEPTVAPTLGIADLRLGVDDQPTAVLVECPVCGARIPDDEIDLHRHASEMRVHAS